MLFVLCFGVDFLCCLFYVLESIFCYLNRMYVFIVLVKFG